MFERLTKRRAPVLLGISADELYQDRRFQTALHRYLDCIGFCSRSDIPASEMERLIENVKRLDSTFFSKIVIRWREAAAFGVRHGGSWNSGGRAAAIAGDESHLYYFGIGWPINWQRWLRDKDCLPCGIWHLNGGPGVREAALDRLKTDDPDTWITTLEMLDAAVYECNPEALRAIGTHEALLTKPLRRCGTRAGSPEEVLNMHTGCWEPTGYSMTWS